MEDKKQEVPELAVIPLMLLNDIMLYLGTKPHTEVDPYIKAIQRDTKLIDKPPVIRTEDKAADNESAASKL
jgi:hypothetical protein